MGELPLARTHMEQGLALYDLQQHRALAVLYGHDPGVCCRGGAAVALWLLGYPDQALRELHAAHALARELAQPSSLAFARMLTAIAYQLRRDTDAAHEQAEALIALATEQGFALFLAMGGILLGGTRTARPWGADRQIRDPRPCGRRGARSGSRISGAAGRRLRARGSSRRAASLDEHRPRHGTTPVEAELYRSRELPAPGRTPQAEVRRASGF
jgi:hypothetical protein